MNRVPAALFVTLGGALVFLMGLARRRRPRPWEVECDVPNVMRRAYIDIVGGWIIFLIGLLMLLLSVFGH